MNKKRNAAKIFRIIGIAFVAIVMSVLSLVNVSAEMIKYGGGTYEFDEGGTLSIYNMTDEEITNVIDQIKTRYEVRDLCLDNCTITNPSLLSRYSVESIIIDNCLIKAESLKFNKKVSLVRLMNYKNTDMSFLEGNSFERFWLELCEFDDLEFLKYLKNVEDIFIGDCSLGSIRGIEKAKGLTYLKFSGVGIEDLSPLKDNKMLDTLELEQTCVNDLSPLESTNIRRLYFSDAPIKSLQPLTKMKNLTIAWGENNEMFYDKEIVDALNSKREDLYEYAEDSAEIQDKVRKLAKSLVNDSMTYEQKIRKITEYVAYHIEYDYEHYSLEDEISTEYNMHKLRYALKGKGVCANYAGLCDALFRECGIECYLQSGDNHIWNVVKIDDDYRIVDATFINAEGFLESNYLAKFEDYSCNPNSYPSSVYLMRRNIQPDKTDKNSTVETVQNNRTQARSAVIIFSIAAVLIAIILLVSFIKEKKAKATETINEYNDEQNENDIE